MNQKMRGIEQYKNALPATTSDTKENKYNEDFRNSNRAKLVLVDAKNINHGGGYSKIEFCDVYSIDKEMFHIKRYSGSSVLSHLFAQGCNSARRLLSDDTFRKKVNAIIPKSFELPVSDSPNASDYTVIFGIISERAGEVPANLPFFSKLTLMRAANELRLMGIKVCVAGIQSN